MNDDIEKKPSYLIAEIIENAPVIEIGELETSENDVSSAKTSKAPFKAEGSGGDKKRQPRPLGFGVEEMNGEYGLVLFGPKAVVYWEQPDAPVSDQQRFLTIEAFNHWFSNKCTEIRGPDGKIKEVTWAKAWMLSERRRQYYGVEFHPDPNNETGTAGYLNLWSGFSVTPAAKSNPQAYRTFRDHLLMSVCRGDEWLFVYLFSHIWCRNRASAWASRSSCEGPWAAARRRWARSSDLCSRAITSSSTTRVM
ncbi:hypothetical protein OGR47_15165 [Methylocystis sp. MJC1]|jgi:hypothetical protein|uniref:hypothetical protein n=1 Tax=Methylocystis sp. MJC1 TaxID=2654282 RepID=UPI0013EB5211|nr:hypothetical protein [Methylocystis sp. MJC1]KAF2988776.1 hypothetical protein MJC1_04144 [Methylocystis sp. MJC1]MBU6528298.1 hypothetical protein [Methylocystis sp. MJC1]UZX11205.1 hypothetical protein OGR47_15165 [Methylocystis sp. MJC1]